VESRAEIRGNFIPLHTANMTDVDLIPTDFEFMPVFAGIMKKDLNI